MININPNWIEAWWSVVTGGSVAIITGVVTVTGGVTLWLCRRQLAKCCCSDKDQLKKIELDETKT